VSDNVYWIVDLKVKDVDAFKALAAEMVASTKEETGALNYEWSLNEDNSICHIYERYEDSAAVMVHMGSFGTKFAERFMALTDVQGFTVYGNPNAEVKNTLAGLSPTYMHSFDGFAR